jgi:7,8-dihydro-6-hydroxymethylpterin-pyrophosphokinase
MLSLRSRQNEHLGTSPALRGDEDALGRTRRSIGAAYHRPDIPLATVSFTTQPDLTICTLLAERKFFLAPLAEIAPGVFHPLLGKTAAAMLDELRSPHRVVKSEP